MQTKFREFIENKRIVAFSRGPKLVSKELKLSLDDFNFAKQAVKARNYKWAIVQSYYSMFHSARALLYIQKFREKSHYCLIESIRELYVKNKKLSFSFAEGFLKEAKRIIREE